MKKSRRVFSFALALVFCVSVMACPVLANDVSSCPDHPGRYSYDFNESAKIHVVYCSDCGVYLGMENCMDWIYNPYDCTASL